MAVKRLDPQTREQLKFDLRMGMGTLECARKYGLSPGTVSGYKQRIEKEDAKAADNPTLLPTGELDMPPGLEPKEWLERVRDNPKAPWEARKAAGLALYKSASTVVEDVWRPAEDPEGWTHDLSLLILAQPPAIAKAVAFKLIEALDLSTAAGSETSSIPAVHPDQQARPNRHVTNDPED